MKKIVRMLGVLVIALALFTNFNINSEKTEADVLAFNVAGALAFAPEVKCADSDNDKDYCVNNGKTYGCKNTTATDDCSGGGAVITTLENVN